MACSYLSATIRHIEGDIPRTSKNPDPPRIYRISSSSCKCLSLQLHPPGEYSLIKERLDLGLICLTQSFGGYRYSISLTNQLNSDFSLNAEYTRSYIPLLWRTHLLLSLRSITTDGSLPMSLSHFPASSTGICSYVNPKSLSASIETEVPLSCCSLWSPLSISSWNHERCQLAHGTLS